jgi:PEP-CTERM motif
MCRFLTYILSVFSLACIAPAHAATLVYDITGTGEASTFQLSQDFVTGTVVPVSTQIGSGSFTATFRVTLPNLPANAASGSAYAHFERYDGNPVFLTSASDAVIGGMQFGIVTDGTDYSRISGDEGDMSIGTDLLSDTGPRIQSNNPLRTFHPSGAVASETTTEIYNQFFANNFLPFFTGGTTVVDGVTLPAFGRGGSIQMVNSRATTYFDELGNRTSYLFEQSQFLGNGTVTLSVLAGVPEPATWGMMILGFGMAGAAMRRRRTTLRAA